MMPIPRGVRIRMLLRSFAVQGSWNYETLIGAGFGFTILPALRHVYRDRPDEMEQALARHTELFNSHPYLATVAAGAVAKLEADGTDPAVVRRFKSALRGSLGSMGDRLVWSAWRPMSLLLGIVLLLGGAAWWAAIGAFLLVYNLLHITLRVVGLRIGVSAGLEVGRLLRDAPLHAYVHRAVQLASFLAGAAIALTVASARAEPLAIALSVGAVAAGFWLGVYARRIMTWILVGVVALGIVLGIIGNAA
jgi:mannose PTS system EIID component